MNMGPFPPPARGRRTLLALVALLALPVLLAGCGGASAGAAPSGEQRFVAGDGTVTTYDAGARREVPALTGRTLDGEPFDLTDLRGQVVVLNVWGSWCAPCRAEAPALGRVAQATYDDGVRFVGINVKDSPAPAAAFVDRFAIPFPSVDGSDGRALLALRDVLPGAIPGTLVVDRGGRAAATVLGSVDEPTLRRILEPLAAEEA